MAVQKFVTYNVLDTDGQVLSEEQKIELSVVEESGNYLNDSKCPYSPNFLEMLISGF